MEAAGGERLTLVREVEAEWRYYNQEEFVGVELECQLLLELRKEQPNYPWMTRQGISL